MSLRSRRDFMIGSAAVAANLPLGAGTRSETPGATRKKFAADQELRRRELWGLLGDLPWTHQQSPPRQVASEKHDGYTLERWLLDLNGIEPVPALILIPDRRRERAPGLLFVHWHAGQYDLGKEQLIRGVSAQPAYAPICAEMGLVTMAIDSWCFGERRHDENGRRGEEDTFKQMLWQGRVLWGMMLFDEFRALSYLASRPEVDPASLGAFGMSMGATKVWWLAALEPRVRLAIDVCCLTDFDAIIKAHGLSQHGIYYFVPSLLKHFSTSQINELVVPRAHLSVNGRMDVLTPPEGVEKVRDDLMPLYRAYGREEDCHIELFDCGHEELPEMRKQIIEWLNRYLAAAKIKT